MFSSCNPKFFAVRHIHYPVNQYCHLASITALIFETVAPSGDHYCIDLVVSSSDHCCTETVPPSSDHY